MFIGNYAATKPYVCLICRGKGCSYCNQQGMKVRNVHLISEEPMNTQHIAMQSHLKNITGEIVVEEKPKEIKDESK